MKLKRTFQHNKILKVNMHEGRLVVTAHVEALFTVVVLIKQARVEIAAPRLLANETRFRKSTGFHSPT